MVMLQVYLELLFSDGSGVSRYHLPTLKVAVEMTALVVVMKNVMVMKMRELSGRLWWRC